LLLDDIRTLLAPTELVARSWPAGIAEADMAILLMGFAAAHGGFSERPRGRRHDPTARPRLWHQTFAKVPRLGTQPYSGAW